MSRPSIAPAYFRQTDALARLGTTQKILPARLEHWSSMRSATILPPHPLPLPHGGEGSKAGDSRLLDRCATRCRSGSRWAVTGEPHGPSPGRRQCATIGGVLNGTRCRYVVLELVIDLQPVALGIRHNHPAVL